MERCLSTDEGEDACKGDQDVLPREVGGEIKELRKTEEKRLSGRKRSWIQTEPQSLNAIRTHLPELVMRSSVTLEKGDSRE